MTAALCCPGPSLAKFAEPPKADLLLGVNRVCVRWPCDWWCASDWQLVLSQGPEVAGSPKLFTRRDSIESLTRRGSAWACRPGKYFDELDCPVAHWSLFTAPAALVLAAELGADRIHVYGVDMAGELDWDGVRAGTYRTGTRWAREGRIWRNVVEWLDGRAVEVIRHGTD